MRTRTFKSDSGEIAVIKYDDANDETTVEVNGKEIYTGGGDRVNDRSDEYLRQGWAEVIGP